MKSTKAVTKKSADVVKSLKKKTLVKKSAKIVATRKVTSVPKRKRFIKKFGIIITLCGLLGMVVLAIAEQSASLKLASLGKSVLGTTNETPAAPSDVIAENTDEGIKISWKNNNPDWKSSSYSHIVYRKNAITGNLIKIAQLWPIFNSEGSSVRVKYNIAPPTSFVDTGVYKNSKYTYYVSTSTRPGVDWWGTELESDLSVGTDIISDKTVSKTPAFSIAYYTPRTITIKGNVNIDKDKLIYYKVNVKKINDDYPYANFYKIYYNRPQGLEESFFLGTTANEVDKRVKLSVNGNQIVASLVDYGIEGIDPDTKYEITLSQVSVTGFSLASNKNVGTISEVSFPSVHAIIKTPVANVEPETPSGLKLESLLTNTDDTKSANFSFKMPTRPLDDDRYGVSGYFGSLSCYDQAWKQVSNWSGEIKAPYAFSEQNRLYFSIGGVDNTAVSCNLSFKAYNKKYNSSSPAYQTYYSPESVFKFNTEVQPDYSASSENKSLHCFVNIPNSLKVKYLLWEYVYSNGTITCKTNELLKDNVIKISDLQSTPKNIVKITSVKSGIMSRQGIYYMYNWTLKFRGSPLRIGTANLSLKSGAVSSASGNMNDITTSNEIITSR